MSHSQAWTARIVIAIIFSATVGEVFENHLCRGDEEEWGGGKFCPTSTLSERVAPPNMALATFKWLRSVFWDRYQIHFQNTLARPECWGRCIKTRLWPFWLDLRLACLQELAISAVGVDDHSSRHFTAMHISKLVHCTVFSAFFRAPPGLSVLRYIQPTTFHPKILCPREEILLCRPQNVLHFGLELKWDETSLIK